MEKNFYWKKPKLYPLSCAHLGTKLHVSWAPVGFIAGRQQITFQQLLPTYDTIINIQHSLHKLTSSPSRTSYSCLFPGLAFLLLSEFGKRLHLSFTFQRRKLQYSFMVSPIRSPLSLLSLPWTLNWPTSPLLQERTLNLPCLSGSFHFSTKPAEHTSPFHPSTSTSQPLKICFLNTASSSPSSTGSFTSEELRCELS